LGLPVALLRLEARAARSRQRVPFRAPVVLGRAPLALDQPVALEPAERREQRTRVNLEHPVADLLDADADAVAVHRLEVERLEDEHVERALHERGRLVGGHRTLFPWTIFRRSLDDL
jgi:hypothetical protein